MSSRLFCNPPPHAEIVFGPAMVAPPVPIPFPKYCGRFVADRHDETCGQMGLLGIYRFTEDGELQICLNPAQGKGSDKRPTKFTTKPEVGAGSMMYTLKK